MEEMRPVCWTLDKPCEAHFVDGTTLRGTALELNPDRLPHHQRRQRNLHTVHTADVASYPNNSLTLIPHKVVKRFFRKSYVSKKRNIREKRHFPKSTISKNRATRKRNIPPNEVGAAIQHKDRKRN